MIDVWSEAHDTGRSKGALAEDEKEEIWEWMKARPKQSPLTLKEARRLKDNGPGRG